jgi:hypothetical protein
MPVSASAIGPSSGSKKAYTKKDVHLVFLPLDPRWDAYREDPRFVDLVTRCGFRRDTTLGTVD